MAGNIVVRWYRVACGSLVGRLLWSVAASTHRVMNPVEIDTGEERVGFDPGRPVSLRARPLGLILQEQGQNQFGEVVGEEGGHVLVLGQWQLIPQIAFIHRRVTFVPIHVKRHGRSLKGWRGVWGGGYVGHVGWRWLVLLVRLAKVVHVVYKVECG